MAGEFLARRRGWVADHRGDDFSIMRDQTPRFLAAQLHAGEITAAARDAAMAAYLETWRRRSAPFYARYVWVHGLAAPAETAEEAGAALAARARYGPPPSFAPLTLAAFAVGKTLLLAGRVDQALPHLERAVAHCFRAQHPFDWVRAHLLLGRARQAKGDVAGACAAYAVVVQRWERPAPRDVRGRGAPRLDIAGLPGRVAARRRSPTPPKNSRC